MSQLHPGTKQAFNLLKNRFELPYTIRLFGRPNLFKTEGARGLSVVEGHNARICILPCDSFSEELDLLAHEYAHLMTFTYSGDLTDAVWGVAYSECYKLLLGEH